jgi:exosortase A-associated hydrolase 1/exosortase A-associated hydrolase 2
MSILRTGYINRSEGMLFLAVFLPESGQIPTQWVVHVPAFGEEMNKSRCMVSKQARLLADAGYGVVVPDLSGTGDSSGEFVESTWIGWKKDIAAVVSWTSEQGGQSVALWGLRLGCLLAADVSQEMSERVSQLVFWQPVLRGKQFMTQFLRLRVAASMMKGEGESVSRIRENMSASGQPVEIAGYLLTQTLLEKIDNTDISTLTPTPSVELLLYEVVSEEGKGLMPATRAMLEQWQVGGVVCKAQAVHGDAFWLTQEIAVAPELLTITSRDMSESLARRIPAAEADCANYELELSAKNDFDSCASTVFYCANEQLAGVLHLGAENARTGVLIVVGGPQYRIGSHRQFVQLAQHLASQGIPVFRFDYRGMGDSTGDLVGFEGIDADIRSAIDEFQHACESVVDIVIWGLCDAATAAVFYAHKDERVSGLVLCNPWVFSTGGAAKAYLRHYYLARIFSKGFWGKIFAGKFDPIASMHSLAALIREAIWVSKEQCAVAKEAEPGGEIKVEGAGAEKDLGHQFYQAIEKTRAKILLILSDNDLTAAEFRDVAKSHPHLGKLLQERAVRREEIVDADHTFSTKSARQKVEQVTSDWCRSL